MESEQGKFVAELERLRKMRRPSPIGVQLDQSAQAAEASPHIGQQLNTVAAWRYAKLSRFLSLAKLMIV